jgi:hypothetical protein
MNFLGFGFSRPFLTVKEQSGLSSKRPTLVDGVRNWVKFAWITAWNAAALGTGVFAAVAGALLALKLLG